MQVREIKIKEIWESFLSNCEEKTFLQSWNWGEFNKMMGDKIWRLGIYEMSNLIGIALVIKIKAKRGTFLLVPHGPIVKTQNSKLKTDILKILLDELKNIAKEEKAILIRISPIWERTQDNNQIFKNLGFKQAPIHTHPEASWKLDITLSENDLLMQMRKTTRYLIHQAQKNNDIEIFQSHGLEDIEKFDKLYQEVVEKQHFVPFPQNYLRNELLAFKAGNQISLFFGRYKDEIVASAFIIFCSSIGFYHHAALSPKYHKLPIAYSLQWEAIKEAKKRGCKLYDFWGYVSPKDKPHHPWAGPTLFKMGFGGEAHLYVKTQDFPVSGRYLFTYIFEKLRKAKRNL